MLEKATRSMYFHLIDAKPLNPSTMMTVAVNTMELTDWTGQAHTLLTCDQQLQKVLVYIK